MFTAVSLKRFIQFPIIQLAITHSFAPWGKVLSYIFGPPDCFVFDSILNVSPVPCEDRHVTAANMPNRLLSLHPKFFNVSVCQKCLAQAVKRCSALRLPDSPTVLAAARAGGARGGPFLFPDAKCLSLVFPGGRLCPVKGDNWHNSGHHLHIWHNSGHHLHFTNIGDTHPPKARYSWQAAACVGQ